MELVCAQRKGCRAGLFETDRDFSDRLNGIEVQWNTCIPAAIGQRADILNDTGFVMGQNQRCETDLAPGQMVEAIRDDPPLAVHIEKTQFPAALEADGRPRAWRDALPQKAALSREPAG